MTMKKVCNKYDLLHLNTPPYARTTIEWDCSRMSTITKNRVLRWLQDPTAKRSARGDAASMYRAIINRFKIPTITIPRRQPSNHYSGELMWHNVSPEVYDEIVKIYKSEQVQRRLNGSYSSWAYEKEEPQSTYLWFDRESEHDFTPLREAVDRMFQGEENVRKIKDAVDFVNSGGKLYFTYDPTDRRYEPE